MFSLHSLMTLAAWAIGILGVGGAVAVVVAAVFFGPTVVIGIIQPILTSFLACTRCVVATVFVVATIGAYWLGHHDAAKECRADELAAQLRNERLDAQAARDAKDDEARRADDIEKQAREQHDADQAYIQQLKSSPGCALGDGDLGGAAGGVQQRPRSGRTHPSGAPR
ncbi:MAG: hypothetical protein J0H40_17660 [Rhizobiales bacterium]|nr:hypothetical protein [Hyphomicrobiales bacterium]